MAIDKPSLNDFLPNGFETQDKDGYKVNFDADKISAGYDKDTLEILSGPNLNNLLDNVGKNTHVLEQFLTFFRDMPIGSFPITNASNQLDYKSVNSFFRNVGELVFSAIPLEDGNLRLLDGSLLEYTMTYSRFITYIAGLRASLPNLFCTEQEFNQSVATYGVCGKFVYDTVTKSLRLPKISGFIKGTLDSGSLGDVDEAKAPNITAKGFMGEAYSSGVYQSFANQASGALYYTGASGDTDTTLYYGSNGGIDADDRTGVFDASRVSSVYKNGATTIEPQSIKEFIYMVVSIDEAEKQVLSAVYNYKGSVENYSDLPTAVAIGEVYNVIGEDPEGYSGANFAWTGEEWDRLGGTVNLSGYLTKTEAQNTYATKASLESNVDNLQEQINTNASNIANIASQEVIDAGIKKIEMLKFASTLGAGKVADTDLYSVIKKYKYSSFDISKFTTTNTGKITNDGIASGANVNTVSNINLSSSPTKWTIISPKYKIAEAATSVLIPFSWGSNATGAVNFTFRANGVVGINYNNTNGTGVARTSNQNVVSINKYYQCKVTYNNGFITLSYRENDDAWVDLATDIAVTNTTSNGVMECSRVATNGITADLKHCLVIADGIEIFNGRKEGMDILKADDYTVVGTPTISADGVASGFSGSNYIQYSVSVTNATDFQLDTPIFDFYKNSVGNNIIFHQASGVTRMQVFAYPNVDTFVMLVNLNGSSELGRGIVNTIDGHKYQCRFIYKNEAWYFYYRDITIGGNWTLAREPISDATPVTLSGSYPLGWQGSNVYFRGNYYDLNPFKIYANKNLIYQPLLRIPYNLSKTGLKVTDKLDRAIDLAEQCGFSQYYGLDEANQLCLVPQGENITGRRELISRVEDSVTHYVTEIYSDLYCRQMGSGTATTAVTLDIPYKDEYYKLSVPQSAKSKTGFTPTASCDWIAEGYIYLDEVA